MADSEIWDLRTITESVAAELEDRALRLRSCKALKVETYAFTSDCPAPEIDAKNMLAGCAVYMLFLKDEADILRARVGYARLAAAKSHKLARDNKVHSRCLYVGSKTVGSVVTRIKEHCGLSYPQTFALHLRHWSGGPLEVLLDVAYFGDAQPDVVQEVEDALWEKHEPMFGKKGRR